jgi:hypothetical protein
VTLISQGDREIRSRASVNLGIRAAASDRQVSCPLVLEGNIFCFGPAKQKMRSRPRRPPDLQISP